MEPPDAARGETLDRLTVEVVEAKSGAIPLGLSLDPMTVNLPSTRTPGG
jgi:hypothetical protein